MNNIKKRLTRLDLDFEFRGNNIKDIYPIPIDEITNETLIAIANKDKVKLKELIAPADLFGQAAGVIRTVLK